MIEAALEYSARGWSVFPLRSKRVPLLPWKEFQGRRPRAEEVRSWWEAAPDACIGVALGRVSNLIRIDADSEAAIAELDRFGGLPNTAEFTTPSGGRGWLLLHMDGVVSEVLWKGDDDHEELRVQSDGAY